MSQHIGKYSKKFHLTRRIKTDLYIYACATGKKNIDQILIRGGMYNLNSSES